MKIDLKDLRDKAIAHMDENSDAYSKLRDFALNSGYSLHILLLAKLNNIITLAIIEAEFGRLVDKNLFDEEITKETPVTLFSVLYNSNIMDINDEQEIIDFVQALIDDSKAAVKAVREQASSVSI